MTIEDVSRYLNDGLFPEGDDWFIETFIKSNGDFIDSEGDVWDFKEDWPFSYSDPYFLNICKLTIAFANTSGGLIIFNVTDKDRRPKKKFVRPNMDRFRGSLGNIVENPPTLGLRQIQLPDGIEIDVVVVSPNRNVAIPSAFMKEFAAKKEIERFWVRVNHETLAARSKHIPILFCGAARHTFKRQPLDSSLPPNPATIRQFVGRIEPFASIFSWLGDPNEPRIFLYGRGGSGKTTIAYEVASCLSDHGRNIDIAGDSFDTIIFVSAKEIELNTGNSSIREFIGKDFTDAYSLLTSIMVLGGWGDFDSLGRLNLNGLLEEFQEFLDTVSAFIVVDDIDTLTTKGIDAGFDQIFRALIRAKRRSKIIYTQRNAPTHSLANAIEVPGLSEEREYPRFVEVCCDQFKVEKPSNDLMDGKMAHVTERRPLVVESIIALRRSAGTYERAITLFEENVGTDAKTYVFEREWNALAADYSRHLLCALALVARPLYFEDIKTILRYEEGRIVEAINDTREMFLDLFESAGQTTYSMGALTRSFVLMKARNLDRYSSIEARVNSFKRSFFPELPELSRLINACETLIRTAQRLNEMAPLEQAWSKLWDESLPAKVTEDPRFRAFRGYVGTRFTPVKIHTVRDDFEFAFSMKFDPPEEHVRAWYIAEEQSGEMMVYGLKVCDHVLSGRSYSSRVKLEFLSRKAALYYHTGKNNRFDNVENAKENLLSALKIHGSVFYVATNSGDMNLYKYEEYYRNTAYLFFYVCTQHQDLDGMIDAMISCAKDERTYLDPFLPAIKEYLPQTAAAALRRGSNDRKRGRLQHLVRLLESDEKWEEKSSMVEVTQLLRRVLEAGGASGVLGILS